MLQAMIVGCLVLFAGCGKEAPKGSLQERGCDWHMRTRAKEGLPAAAGDRAKCVASIGAMEARTTASGFTCAISCLQTTGIDAAEVEECVFGCEMQALPMTNGQPDPAKVEEVSRAWSTGIVGDRAIKH